MRNSVVALSVLAVLLATILCIQAGPQGNTKPGVKPALAPATTGNNRSPNPQVNLLRQGLIEKLCKKTGQTMTGGGSATSSTTSTTTASPTSSSSTTGRPRRGNFRRTRQANKAPTSPVAAAAAGPSCDKYNEYTFAQLIEENKKLLRPVGSRRP